MVVIQLRYTSALDSTDVSLDLWPWVLAMGTRYLIAILVYSFHCGQNTAEGLAPHDHVPCKGALVLMSLKRSPPSGSDISPSSWPLPAISLPFLIF